MSDFEGFEPANTVPVPDVLFDQLLSELKEAELKCLLYIIRRTTGFKKTTDAISLSQFQRGIVTRDKKRLDNGCGIKDRTTIVKALESLEEKKCIERVKAKTASGDKDTTRYRIYFKEVVGNSDHQTLIGSGQNLPPVVGIPYHGSGQNLPPVVGIPDSQETVIQGTGLQETDSQESTHSPLSSLSTDELLAELRRRDALPANPGARKPKALSDEDNARIDRFLACMDKAAQEALEEDTKEKSDFTFRRTKKDRDTIHEFLHGRPISEEQIRMVYLTMWKSKPGTNGFHWRDNMSIAAFCRNYDTMRLRATGNTTASTDHRSDEAKQRAEENNRDAMEKMRRMMAKKGTTNGK